MDIPATVSTYFTLPIGTIEPEYDPNPLILNSICFSMLCISSKQNIFD